MPEKLQLYSMPKRLEVPKFWVEHIPFAFYIVSKLKPGIIVELGTHTGNSFFAFCQAVAENKLATECYAIDTWKGDKYTGPFAEEIYENVLEYQQKNYPEMAKLLRMTFDEGLTYFKNGTIDLLHIDGLHTYEAVKHDFESWLPKLSDKAIVLFHDTQIKMKDFGIWKFWAEVCKQYPSFEFYHGCGLGVLVVGKNVPTEIVEFINSANKGNEYRDIFEKQGRIVYKEYKRRKLKADVFRLLKPHKIVAKRLKRI